MQRKECVKSYLEKKNYELNTKAFEIIKMCDSWYANRSIQGFHDRKTVQGQEYKLNRMNFAKRCCSDDANLCEIISAVPEKDSNAQAFIEKFLQDNRFDVRYREQLEKTSASGTSGAYIYLKNASYLTDKKGMTAAKGGELRINYVDADCIIPLTVDNGLITEAAFSATSVIKGKIQTTLVIFAMDERGSYTAETAVFDKNGKEKAEKRTVLQLGNVKPFAIMKNAEVNNIDDMEWYGLPKVYNAIPVFKALDLCYNVLFSDLDKAEKIVLLNEAICTVRNEDGSPRLTPEQKKIFLLLGEKLPEEKSVYQEYNPNIRIDQITKCFELVLSLVSMSFGYGTKKYSFENGQIKTATEYIGERQDAMQELNKQRREASCYVTDIIHAAMWFSNAFLETSFDTEEPLSIQFDDSFITDRQTELEAMRADAISFPEIPWLKMKYLQEKYNLSDKEVKEYLQSTGQDGEEEEDID